MATLSNFQIAQIVLTTAVFITHLITFYDLSESMKTNMVMLETTVYGTYFVIIIGYLIALLSGDNFAPPLEVVMKLYGAVLFNVVGLSRAIVYLHIAKDDGFRRSDVIFGLIKSFCAIAVCILYYTEVFQA